jgi:hypothetical protein
MPTMIYTHVLNRIRQGSAAPLTCSKTGDVMRTAVTDYVG